MTNDQNTSDQRRDNADTETKEREQDKQGDSRDHGVEATQGGILDQETEGGGTPVQDVTKEGQTENPALIFLDTETTGIEEEDRIIQLAYKKGDFMIDSLVKPPIPIKIMAMATHHITNKQVEDVGSFQDTFNPALNNNLKGSILVAHNAKFDVGMLKKEGIEPEQVICTMKVAKFLDPEEKIESYSLQYLRYFMNLEIEATAHDALGDIIILEAIFKKLNERMSIERMIEISKQPSMMRSFSFGKYRGKKLEEVLKVDKGYLEWLLNEKSKEPAKEEDWIFTLKHYLKL